MKIKSLTIALALAAGLNASAQDLTSIPNLDLQEDTAEVTTVADIVKMQQRVLTNKNTEDHYSDVWRRKSYFNISYLTTTFKSDKLDKNYKSDWGISIQSGKNYCLHKKPIQNMVSIALDFSWLNLSVNHYKNNTTKGYCYDSSKKDIEGNYVTPWDLQKYEASYGMNIGPSVTVAPFIPLNNKILDHIKIQGYFHVGYNVSFLYMVNDKSMDKHYHDTNEDNYDTDVKNMSNNLKLMWGHGMDLSFGCNVFWKFIGVGYEHFTGNLDYKHINTDDFGSDKYKFNKGTNRIYVTFRF